MRRMGGDGEVGVSLQDRSAAPTWRGWALGLSATVLLAGITPHIEYVSGRNLITVNLLPVAPMMVLLLLVMINSALRILKRRMQLAERDLAMVAAMTLASAALPAYGFISWIVGVMTNAQYGARPENKWSELILPHQPDWLVPHDPIDPHAVGPRPIEWLMTGLPPGESIPWSAWWGPYAWWALLALMIFAMMFCLCSLLWKQWEEYERLPFPLAQVPSALIGGTTAGDGAKVPFFQNRMALIGMGLSFGILSWNYMGELYAGWPTVNMRFSPSGYLRGQPWEALNPLFMLYSPAMIGLAFLLPIDVGFSLWFFYLVVQKLVIQAAVQVGLGQHGWDFYSPEGHRGLIIDQGTGALLAFVFFGLWMARRHIASMWRAAWGFARDGTVDDDEGPMSARASFLVLAGCFAGSCVWLTAAGLTLFQAALALIILLVVMLGLTRLSAEGGLFDMQVRMAPADTLNIFLTPAALGPQSIVALSMFSRAFSFDWGRTAPMVGMMTGLRVAGEARLRRRSMAWGAGIAVVLALGVGFVATLTTVYTQPGGVSGLRNGWGLTGASNTDYRVAARDIEKINLLESRKESYAQRGESLPASENLDVAKRDNPRFFWMAAGVVVALALAVGRTFVFWLPHPIGYVMWMHPRTMQEYWFPILIGWLCKWAVSKYGGYKVYHSVKYLFIGLVVGEVAATGVWLVIFKWQGLY